MNTTKLNAADRRPTRLRERFFHAPGNASWEGDSYRGLEVAGAHGFRWADVNQLTDRNGLSVCAHWGQPLTHGWFDPEGRIHRHGRVRDLVWSTELARLRLRNGQGYRIRTTEQIIVHAGQVGIGLEVELKNGHWTREQAEHLRTVAHTHDVPVLAKTIAGLGGWEATRQRLEVFHAAGWRTVVLPRGLHRVPRSWWPFVDEVRGRVTWTRG